MSQKLKVNKIQNFEMKKQEKHQGEYQNQLQTQNCSYTVLLFLQRKLKQNQQLTNKIEKLSQRKPNYVNDYRQTQQNKGISQLFQLRPSIKNIQRMSSLANEVYKIQFTNERRIVCKIYHNVLNQFTDKNIQHLIVKTMSQQNQYPQIYYYDQECRIEGFIQAQALSYEQLNDQILNAIIHKLSAFSNKCASIINNFNIQHNQPKRSIRNLFKTFKTIYKNKQKQCSELLTDCKQLFQSILAESVLQTLQKALPQIYIVSHNDCNLSNVLLTQNKNQSHKTFYNIMLIDFQFAQLNYLGFDIGNFFNELATDYDKIFQIRSQWELSPQVKQKLTKMYFHRLQLEESIRVKLNLNNFLNQSRIVKNGRMLSHLYWMFVGLNQINDKNVQIDMKYYIKRRHQQFFKYYNQFEAVKETQ